MYLIPGLWDMHVHPDFSIPVTAATYPRADALYRELLANGIIGIRDTGDAISLDTIRAWKRAIAAGRRFDRAALDRLLVAADAEWRRMVEAQQRAEAQAPSQPSPPQP